MKITDVKIYPLKAKKGQKSNNVKAFASVTVDKVFCVTGIRVIDGKNGLFINFPQQKGSDDEYYDICFPLNKETRELFTEAVVEAYEKE